MCDWKEERKKNRAAEAESKIRQTREDLKRDEELISAIETSEVMVYAREPGLDTFSKVLMDKRGFLACYCDTFHKVAVGVHKWGTKKDIVALRLALSNNAARARLRRSKYEDIININLKDEEALDEALVIFHGIYLILNDFKKRNQKEAEKAKEKEAENGV